MSIEDVIADAVRTAVRDAVADLRQPPRKCWRPAEVAQMLGRSERFVQREIEEGRMKASRSGPNGHLMVADAEVDRWLASLEAA